MAGAARHATPVQASTRVPTSRWFIAGTYTTIAGKLSYASRIPGGASAWPSVRRKVVQALTRSSNGP